MNAKAQEIKGNLSSKVDTINKAILDNAKFRVFYTLEFVNDSTNPQLKNACQTILLIGSHFSAFLDYNKLRKDSLYDALSKKNASSMEVISTVMPVAKQAKFTPIIIKNYPRKKTSTFQQMILSQEVYRYSSPVEIQWSLGNREKEMMGYKCKDATCNYRGRQYTAWYALDIPISEGPYVFSGLPGLIMSISDSKDHYSFVINGLITINAYDPIYLSTDHVIEASREQVRKVISNTRNNPASVLKSLAGKTNISEETMNKLQPKPYNPIELE
jgi:GLPGLI family protein